MENFKIKNLKLYLGVATIVAGMATCSACGNEESKESETTTTTSITTTTEVETQTEKAFVTTSFTGELSQPIDTLVNTDDVDSDDALLTDNVVEVTYDTTMEVPIADLKDKGINISGDHNNVNVIINAPVYSISAESVEIENGDQIINDQDMDCFNDNENSYNGNHEHIMSAETTVAATTTAAPKTTVVTAAAPKTTTTTAAVTTTPLVITTEDTEAQEPIKEEFKPAITKLTAEDILRMSRNFADYLNQFDGFKHRNYKFDAFDMTDLYSVIYLTNIDYVSAEETKRLIDGGFISEDIKVNIQNSFYFFSFYVTHSINKIQDGNSGIIDISQIFVDKKGAESYQTMYKMMTSFNSNKESQNIKNYKDLVFYFAENTTIKNRNGYDYSKSIFKDDREVLMVGSDYTLCRIAGIIGEMAKVKKYTTEELINIFDTGREDLSDIMQVFNGYLDKDKCLTKTR